jgi:NAD(P)-dependent dehydrogenase (short-subunit alcohol dehydrogenase family)
MMMYDANLLEGRVALVTGASRGLGRHFAQLLARHGAQVVAVARDAAALVDLARDTRDADRPLIVTAVDVRDAASVDRAVQQAATAAGRLDIVINNAGVALTKAATATTDDDWNAVIDTNLSGAFRVARAAAKAMEAAGNGGSIVNIASVLALRVTKQIPAYIAAKAGLVKLTEALALEWAAQHIRVNALAPGYIVTDLNREFLRSPAGESMAKRVPMRRFGQPKDLDGALLLLASDAGRYITGATITVDGGHALAWL